MNARIFQVLGVILIFASCAVPPEKDSKTSEIVYPENLGIRSRQNWGFKSSPKSLEKHTIQKITICQSGIDLSMGGDPVTHFNDSQSKSRPSSNISYHFLIDADGHIYEAQPVYLTMQSINGFDPSGHILICVLGNYETNFLNQSQMKALIELTAFLVGEYHVALYNIQSLNAYTTASAAGKNLFQYLDNGTLQARVQEQLPK